MTWKRISSIKISNYTDEDFKDYMNGTLSFESLKDSIDFGRVKDSFDQLSSSTRDFLWDFGQKVLDQRANNHKNGDHKDCRFDFSSWMNEDSNHDYWGACPYKVEQERKRRQESHVSGNHSECWKRVNTPNEGEDWHSCPHGHRPEPLAQEIKSWMDLALHLDDDE